MVRFHISYGGNTDRVTVRLVTLRKMEQVKLCQIDHWKI